MRAFAKQRLVVRVGSRTIVISGHALERWREREVDAYGMIASELRAVLQGGHIARARPSWLESELADQPAAAYLLVGEHVAFPLVDTGRRLATATTALVREAQQ